MAQRDFRTQDQRRTVPHLAIVLLDDALISSAGVFIDLAQAARNWVGEQYGAVDPLREENFDVIKVTLLGASNAPVRMAGGSSWAVEGIVGGDYQYDMIALANFGIGRTSQPANLRNANPRLMTWLRQQHEAGAYIAATGAACFALAEAGLLNGRRATTCWWLHRQFHEYFPSVKIDVEHALTEDGRILCSGTIAGDNALALRMFEHVVSPNLADYLSRLLGIDRSPLNVVFSPTATHLSPDRMVARAEHWLQLNYSRAITINELADAMAVSRSTLVRHFSAALGTTPIDYLHTLRINDARAFLQRATFSISRIASLVGYSDVKFFKMLFENKVGMSPRDYRDKIRSQTIYESKSLFSPESRIKNSDA